LATYIPTTGEKFDALQIRLASPEEIRKWSRGEVKRPETINYRTFKPERDGLFCERIFGPTKDWECGCGKYKKVKHRGIVCDRCGVEITEARVRRERMGHINLTVPIAHIWFFKNNPSCIGSLLNLPIRSLERVIYYEHYLVLDPGSVPELAKLQLLSQDEYDAIVAKYGRDAFDADMGAPAIRKVLMNMDLDQLASELRVEFHDATSAMHRAKLVKRMKIVEALRKSGNRPEWMILEVIPVMPPDLRPLVPLDGGRYATSDLNDLYRRVINRNNRLNRLIELRAPEVILRNEKRMLQEAVDALFDNGRHGRPVTGTNGRQLKSLSDMLKGKQGRFRQNLLGKRVDYSGRSVIVVGPELKLHQCGLPKRMVLELFEPFIINQLRERGHVATIKTAKKMIQQNRTEVWDVLEDVIRDHPVMLNRAPTLHRLSIQAFQPVMIEGKAIRLHPLVCRAFNADFDGDQMAVHVPLFPPAQLEALLLMMSSTNIFSPSDGSPIVTPTQDIVLGIAWLTKQKKGVKGEWRKEWSRYEDGREIILKPGKVFPDCESVVLAHERGEIDIHAEIRLRFNGKILATTVGRVILAQHLPKEITIEDVNRYHDQASIGRVIAECYRRHGHHKTTELLDALKAVGFKYATRSGLSIAIEDLLIPKDKKELVQKGEQEVRKIELQHAQGLCTAQERYSRIVDQWTEISDQLASKMMDAMKENDQGFTGVYLMFESGARGSKKQIRQLAAMRGLMSKPNGDIIESPIFSNFREGLTVVEYFISSHGARKGLSDTALKTADAGYLTRRLVDVAQDVVIEEEDCGTLNGIWVEPLNIGQDTTVSLAERIVGRYALDDIYISGEPEPVVRAGEEIDEAKAKRIVEAELPGVTIRSVLTCQSKKGVCAKCYGRNLATGRLVELGEAVGIIAAQSIGEPGTQLTMRTFHIGGAASRKVETGDIRANESGTVHFLNVKTTTGDNGVAIVLNRGGEILIRNAEGKELQRELLGPGFQLLCQEGAKVRKGAILVRRDPYNDLVVAEADGEILLEGMEKGVTIRMEINKETGLEEIVVTEHRHDKHPQITIRNPETKEVLAFVTLRPGTHVLVADKARVSRGETLAKTPREMEKTSDITGGLPRVEELFEARQPKNPAIISPIEGVVHLDTAAKNMRRIVIKPDVGKEWERLVPMHKHINVQTGDKVYPGQRLTDGPINPQDILEVLGEDALRKHLLDEIQKVYRAQGVRTNDKHIEVIIRQMLRKVRIKDDPGDTPFLAQEEVDRIRFEEENRNTAMNDGRPAEAEPILQGISKAALSTSSFVAAASFQLTTRVLTEAAVSGKTDYLTGLKENVIIGHLIPAGTGSHYYQKSRPVVREENVEDLLDIEDMGLGVGE